MANSKRAAAQGSTRGGQRQVPDDARSNASSTASPSEDEDENVEFIRRVVKNEEPGRETVRGYYAVLPHFCNLCVPIGCRVLALPSCASRWINEIFNPY